MLVLPFSDVVYLKGFPTLRIQGKHKAWSQFIVDAAKQGIRREYPQANEQEVALILVARQYGQIIADGVRAHLARRTQQ